MITALLSQDPWQKKSRDIVVWFTYWLEIVIVTV